MRIDTDTAANLAASNVVHREWIGHYDQLPDRVGGVRVVQSWDVGTTINKGSSFSVCTTWAVDKKTHWHWHLDEVFVRINGETYDLWRAIDHEGEVLEAYVTKKRDRRAALRFLKKVMKKHGNPNSVVTDRLRSYRAAMNVIGNSRRHVTGQWQNNRAENSHQPFRRRERAMAKFRNPQSLQKFAAIHSSIHNHFNLERHLYNRQQVKLSRTAALAEWRQLALCSADKNSLRLSSIPLTKPLNRIGNLYAIEKTIHGQSPDERLRVRNAKSKPLVEALKTWLENQLTRVPIRSALAEGIRYALARWPALCLFLEDGRIELDNNPVERAIRPVALGRKNHLFPGSDGGADRWAIVTSLIATAKLNDIEPYAHLKDVLERMTNGHPVRELDDLLPWKCTAPTAIH